MGFNQNRPESWTEHPTHQGGRGFKPSPQQELFLLVSAALFSGDAYYEKDGDRAQRLYSLASELTVKDPQYVADLAIYARNVLGLRSGPSALVAHLFWEGPVEEARRAARGVWLRGDEHLETLAYTLAQGWKLRHALKEAVAERLNEMSPQALVKYARGGRQVTQADAIRLTHPSPRDEAHNLTFRYLVGTSDAEKAREAREFVNGLRERFPSWEAILSQKGSTPEAWREALPHMKGLSLIRNLRNLALHGLLSEPEVRFQVLKGIEESTAPKHFLQPYHYLEAIRALDQSFPGNYPEVRSALLEAMERSAEASTHLGRQALVLVDVSASMYSPLSQRSSVRLVDAAASIGATLYKGGAEVYLYDNDATRLEMSREASIYDMVEWALRQGGGGTYLGETFRSLLPYTRAKVLLVITDEQVADDAFSPLREWLAQDGERRCYVINVAGYEPTAFPERNVVRIAGFSDRLLHVIDAFESQDIRLGVRKALDKLGLAPEEGSAEKEPMEPDL